MATTPTFASTPRLGVANVSTANTGLDVNLGATGDVHVNITDYYIAA